MKMKRIIAVALAACMIASLSGCVKSKTPEEIEAESLAAVAAEEEAMGMKRLDSPNLADYEKPLADFVSGIQAGDANTVANALGSINVFGDSLESWVVSNNYDAFKTLDPHEIYIQTAKDGKVATINVFLEAPNEDKSNFVTYTCDFDGTKWSITPPSGLLTNYVFYAPVSDVTVNDVSVSQYATSEKKYGYTFTIPRIADSYDHPSCVLKTSIGDYSGIIQPLSQTTYTQGDNVAMAQFTDEQKAEANQHLVDCINNVFNLIRTNADKNAYSAYLLDADAVNDIFPGDEESRNAVITGANDVTAIEIQSTSSVENCPNDYIYHLSGTDSITMNVNYNAILTSGECHRTAAITITYTNGTWKISKIDSANSLFVGLSAFNPEW